MMKLSEAIRLGAMLDKQTRFRFATEDGTCALGAALRAMSIQVKKGALTNFDYDDAILMIRKLFPEANRYAPHPITKRIRATVADIIMSLNDKYKWDRNRIADWVETIEPQEVDSSQQVADDVKSLAISNARLQADGYR